MKVCNNCKIQKSFDSFSPNTTGKDGLRGECKSCRNKKYKPKTSKRQIRIKTRKKEISKRIRKPTTDLVARKLQ